MNVSKFTQKSIEAIKSCEKLAYEFGNQEIEQEHLFYALLSQDDSLILKMMEKMNIDKNLILNRATICQVARLFTRTTNLLCTTLVIFLAKT